MSMQLTFITYKFIILLFIKFSMINLLCRGYTPLNQSLRPLPANLYHDCSPFFSLKIVNSGCCILIWWLNMAVSYWCECVHEESSIKTGVLFEFRFVIGGLAHEVDGLFTGSIQAMKLLHLESWVCILNTPFQGVRREGVGGCSAY